MANKFTKYFPADIDDVLFQIEMKANIIKKWYIYSIVKDREDRRWYYLVKSSNRNKYKFEKSKLEIAEIGKTIFLTRPEAEIALQSSAENEKNRFIRKEYYVQFKCGHIGSEFLNGTPVEVEQKIINLSKKICRVCRNKESERKGLLLVRMPYAEYKKHHRNCDTKVDSYDSESETIEVYLNQEG